MSLVYAGKHVVRSWQLFLALLLGIMLASAFFAGIVIKANVTTEQALDQQLSTVYKDLEITSYSQPLNLTQLDTVQQQLSQTENVKSFEVITRTSSAATVKDETNQSTELFTNVVGISDNSRVYNGWLNRPSEGLGENETYIAENANVRFGSGQLKVGDVVSINFTIFNPENGSLTLLPLNLTVRGFAQLDDEAYNIATGYGPQIMPMGGVAQINLPPFFASDFLLVDWEKTIKPFVEASNNTDSMPFQQSVLVYIDRESLISAWDIQGSVTNLQVLQNNIGNKINSALGFQVDVQNNLLYQVQSFQFISFGLMFSFFLVSLPIFFMAWYMGTTVSDVSFNSRRREIGLLATKGFSIGQVSRIFLVETILIGIMGSLLGVLLGFFLTPLFAPTSNGVQFNLQTISSSTVVFTVIFGLIMAFLSTYMSSRRAAKLSTVGALREYLPSEPVSPYRKRLAWLAFILGTYKIAVFIAGINVQVLLNNAMFSSGNFILLLLSGIWISIDGVLNYIGPLLFFWGFAKLFIQGSLKFQELTVRASKFLGDIGTLATKNVRRKPARAAAIAFLIALIVWYSVLVTGQLASERDYTNRQTYANVGADITASVANVSQAQAVLNNILANVSGIKDATVEYSISAQQGVMTLKAVDPQEWLKTAYYEADWFSGASVQNAFDALAADNNTIILDRSVAKSYNLNVGDDISVEFENGTKALKVVGFFGPEPQDQTSIGIGIMPRIGSAYWSFVPINLYAYPGNLTSASAKILMKIDAGADGVAVAKNVLNVDASVAYVDSVANELEKSQTNAITAGALEVQQLGVIFAVLAASVGTALISTVSMKERSREATIMSVKGLSYKQLVVMFLTENFALVTFAIALGVSVGLISVYGNVSSANAQISGLVVRHLIFPLGSTLLVVGCVALIFAATILPVIVMSRKYVTKLERMVRLR
jgi:ABC-type lipoprotein release transport system permease subunit